MMLKKSRKSVLVDESVQPGWGRQWALVYRTLLMCGGTPGDWTPGVQTGGCQEVLTVLQGVVPEPRAPLQGVQRRMWILATAWKTQHRYAEHLGDKNTELENELTQLKKQFDEVTSTNTDLTKVVVKAVAQVSAVARKQRRKRERRATPKQIKAFLAKQNAEDWDPGG